MIRPSAGRAKTRGLKWDVLKPPSEHPAETVHRTKPAGMEEAEHWGDAEGLRELLFFPPRAEDDARGAIPKPHLCYMLQQ